METLTLPIPNRPQTELFPVLDSIAKIFGHEDATALNKSFRQNLVNEGGRSQYRYGQHYNPRYNPRTKLTFAQREILARDVGYLQLAIDQGIKEQYRNGIEVEKAYSRICEECEKRYEEDLEVCDTINDDGSACEGTLKKPLSSHQAILSKMLIEHKNSLKQSLEIVGIQISKDVEKHDYGLGIVRFLYKMDKVNKTLITNYNEDGSMYYEKSFDTFYRGDPSRIRPALTMIRSEDDNKLTNIYLVCPLHRNNISIIDSEKLNINHRCTFDGCGFIMEFAEYILFENELSDTPVEAYLIDEVIKISKKEPALPMGASKIDSLVYSCLFLLGNDRIMSEYATDKRVPRAFLLIKMRNYERYASIIEQEWEKWMDDPLYIPKIPAEIDGSVEKIDLDAGLMDMNNIGQRDEHKKLITSAYGVSNVFTNDTSTSGGLNNEGMQMVVTNRYTEFSHKITNSQLWKVLSALIIGCKESELGYTIKHVIHEEVDRMADLEIESKQMQNAEQAQRLGADIIIDERGDFKIQNPLPNAPLVPRDQMMGMGMGLDPMMGGMGSMGGMGIDMSEPTDMVKSAHAVALPRNHGRTLADSLFNYEYSEWEFKDDYSFQKFLEIPISSIKQNEDFKIHPEDIVNNSPRVRPATIEYYMSSTEPMAPLIVDQGLHLLDGNHRMYVLELKGVSVVRVAVVKSIVDELAKSSDGGRSWDDYTYEEQTAYLQQHPKSQRRITASKTGKPEATDENKENIKNELEDKEEKQEIEEEPNFTDIPPQERSYDQIINSAEFKSWFGDWTEGEGSKIVKDDGSPEVSKPIPVFHGTTHDFEIFDYDRGNIQNDLGRGFYFTSDEQDADSNYADAENSPDLTQKISMSIDQYDNMVSDDYDYFVQLAEEAGIVESDFEDEDDFIEQAKQTLAENDHKGDTEKTLKVFLNIRNPIVISEQGGSFIQVQGESIYPRPDEDDFDDEDEYQEALEEWENDYQWDTEESPLQQAMIAIGNEYGFSGYDLFGKLQQDFYDDISAYKLDQWLREQSELMDYAQEYSTGDFAGNQAIQEIFRELGADGFIIKNAGKRFRGMNMAPNATHYIAFKPNQVKHFESEKFDPSDDNMYKSALKKNFSTWEDMSYQEQKAYLDNHPKSKKRITASPSDADLQMEQNEKKQKIDAEKIKYDKYSFQTSNRKSIKDFNDIIEYDNERTRIKSLKVRLSIKKQLNSDDPNSVQAIEQEIHELKEYQAYLDDNRSDFEFKLQHPYGEKEDWEMAHEIVSEILEAYGDDIETIIDDPNEFSGLTEEEMFVLLSEAYDRGITSEDGVGAFSEPREKELLPETMFNALRQKDNNKEISMREIILSIMDEGLKSSKNGNLSGGKLSYLVSNRSATEVYLQDEMPVFMEFGTEKVGDLFIDPDPFSYQLGYEQEQKYYQYVTDEVPADSVQYVHIGEKAVPHIFADKVIQYGALKDYLGEDGFYVFTPEQFKELVKQDE